LSRVGLPQPEWADDGDKLPLLDLKTDALQDTGWALTAGEYNGDVFNAEVAVEHKRYLIFSPRFL
jgi:hypothetical protein